VRTTLDIPATVFKKTKLKAVQEGVPLKVVVTRALEREVGGGKAGAANGAGTEHALAPQLRFLAMNRAERAKAFRKESKAMARFYAEHPDEVLADFYDEPEHEPKAR
jgi:hypothetical protein